MNGSQMKSIESLHVREQKVDEKESVPDFTISNLGLFRSNHGALISIFSFQNITIACKKGFIANASITIDIHGNSRGPYSTSPNPLLLFPR